MLALNPEGQKHFKEELHVALEQSKPGAELSFTVAAWMFTKYLVMDREEGRDLRSILKRLPELTKASEDLTLEQFAKRIGLR